MTAWIKMIADDEADETLKPFFDRVRTPHGTVDNVMRAHSLRPHTMDGHVALYRSVLHNPDNTLPFWFLEVVASYVSILNNCDYSLSHHFTNARRLIGDDARADAVRAALDAHRPEDAFDGKELALLVYAGKLTTEVGAMAEADIGAVDSRAPVARAMYHVLVRHGWLEDVPAPVEARAVVCGVSQPGAIVSASVSRVLRRMVKFEVNEREDAVFAGVVDVRYPVTHKRRVDLGWSFCSWRETGKRRAALF